MVINFENQRLSRGSHTKEQLLDDSECLTLSLVDDVSSTWATYLARKSTCAIQVAHFLTEKQSFVCECVCMFVLGPSPSPSLCMCL